VTVHLVTYEHADNRLSRVRVSLDEHRARVCFDDWVVDEEDNGENGTLGVPSSFDPEGAVRVWRGEYGSRIIRFAVEAAG
jgi:hypothetical protein